MAAIWGAVWGVASLTAYEFAQHRLSKFATGAVGLVVIAITIFVTVRVAHPDQFFWSWLFAGVIVVTAGSMLARRRASRL